MRQAADLARESCPDDKKKDLTLSGGRCAIPGNELKLPKSFAAFCEENSSVRDMIETGKGNLQWERDIPQQPCPTWRTWPLLTSKPTLARSSTTSTRLLTLCSVTCHRETTRRGPSTGLPPRLS